MKKYKDGETRKRFEDESYRINLDVELKDGSCLSIVCRRYLISEIEEYYSKDDDMWYKEDGDELDGFYLTLDEKQFTDEDISKIFDIEDYFGEWDDTNGWSDDHCGIDEGDDLKTSIEKFEKYKSKFEKVTSKDQFDII